MMDEVIRLRILICCKGIRGVCSNNRCLVAWMAMVQHLVGVKSRKRVESEQS